LTTNEAVQKPNKLERIRGSLIFSRDLITWLSVVDLIDPFRFSRRYVEDDVALLNKHSVPISSTCPIVRVVWVIRDPLDVVHQAVQSPPCVDLTLAAQRESIHALVVPQIGKHRLYRSYPFTVQRSAPRAISGVGHLIEYRIRAGLVLLEDHHLANRSSRLLTTRWPAGPKHAAVSSSS
jgi:hypothetical protein